MHRRIPPARTREYPRAHSTRPHPCNTWTRPTRCSGDRQQRRRRRRRRRLPAGARGTIPCAMNASWARPHLRQFRPDAPLPTAAPGLDPARPRLHAHARLLGCACTCGRPAPAGTVGCRGVVVPWGTGEYRKLGYVATMVGVLCMVCSLPRASSTCACDAVGPLSRRR